MTDRPFALIGCTLPHSEAMRALPDHAHRWAYVCLHLSRLNNNFHGLFWMLPENLAADVPCTPDDARQMLANLASAGLIDWDDREHFVRITQWHLKENRPHNQSTAISRLRDLDKLRGPDDMLRRNVAELLLTIIRRLTRWNPEKEITDKLHKLLDQVFRRECRIHGADLVRDMIAAGASETDDDLWQILRMHLPEVVPDGTMPAPCQHRGRIRRLYGDEDKDDTETETDTETESKKSLTTRDRRGGLRAADLQ